MSPSTSATRCASGEWKRATPSSSSRRPTASRSASSRPSKSRSSTAASTARWPSCARPSRPSLTSTTSSGCPRRTATSAPQRPARRGTLSTARRSPRKADLCPGIRVRYRNISPAGVRKTPAELLTKSSTPSSFSRALICLDKDDCETYESSPAREKFLDRATAKKYSNCAKFTATSLSAANRPGSTSARLRGCHDFSGGLLIVLLEHLQRCLPSRLPAACPFERAAPAPGVVPADVDHQGEFEIQAGPPRVALEEL